MLFSKLKARVGRAAAVTFVGLSMAIRRALDAVVAVGLPGTFWEPMGTNGTYE